MRTYIYQNKQNGNKYIILKRYDCGHYYWQQYMQWETPRGTVINWNGNTRNRRHLRRVRRAWWEQVLLADYTCIGV